MMKTIYNAFRRPPDFIVGGWDNPYMLRWWIIPRNRFFNIYLHKFLRDDEDRALHDHPWPSLSIIIKGGYLEHLQNGSMRMCGRFTTIFRRSTHRHRIELFKPANRPCHERNGLPAWTIFITGPRIREWGFWCGGERFVHWQEFTSPDDKGKTGKGCG